jgi:hypothetical protein
MQCQLRDKNRVGYYQYYTVNPNNTIMQMYGYQNSNLEYMLPVGNYAIEDEYGTYHCFTTKVELTAQTGAYMVFDTTNGWTVV